MDQLNASELMAVGGALGNTDPNQYGNRADIELQWAMQAYHHAETYNNLIKSVDPRFLKLTQLDDEIYTTFREAFPDTRVDKLDIEELKSPEGKKKWREYCNMYEKRVENFNMGTLMRLDSSQEFSEENSTMAVRIQFLAIEIARNREGYNDGLKKDVKSNEAKQSS